LLHCQHYMSLRLLCRQPLCMRFLRLLLELSLLSQALHCIEQGPEL